MCFLNGAAIDLLVPHGTCTSLALTKAIRVAIDEANDFPAIHGLCSGIPTAAMHSEQAESKTDADLKEFEEAFQGGEAGGRSARHLQRVSRLANLQCKVDQEGFSHDPPDYAMEAISSTEFARKRTCSSPVTAMMRCLISDAAAAAGTQERT